VRLPAEVLSAYHKTKPEGHLHGDGIAAAVARPTAAHGTRSATVFVWGTWAAMLLVAIAAVAVYGRNIPFAEDWFLVAPLTGNEPDLFRWAWAQNSEHLVPVPKLLLLLLLRLTGGDFRAGMVFNALLLGVVAAAMILVARHLRGGRIKATDALFPLALLHLGHWDNLLWSWQLQFVLSTALTCILLLMVVAWREGPATPITAAAAGVCLVFLPLSGGNGVIVVPGFALWALLCGVLQLRREPSQAQPVRTTAVLIGTAAIALLIVVVYLVGYERPTWNAASPSLLATAETSIKFVALAFGPGAKSAWFAVSFAASSVLLISGAALFAGARLTSATERRRVFGLSLLVAAFVALALAIGVGRAAKVEASGYMSTRYALLSVPMLCASYFIVELYARRSVRNLTQGALLLIALGLLPLNTKIGFQRRDWFQRGLKSFQSDVQAGMPLEVLADRHFRFLVPWSRDGLASGLTLMQQACLGPFAHLGACSTTSPGR
jgi:hypothetical protein